MKRFLLLFIILYTFKAVHAQSLFDDAIMNENNSPKNQIMEIGGYLRTGIITNFKLDNIKNNYSETALNLKLKNDIVNCFSDIRLSLNKTEIIMNLREAWIEIYLGSLDFRLGNQIISWGRADGINPTDNLTPKDYSKFKNNEDDYKIANISYRARYYLPNITFEGVLIPFYKYSEIFYETDNKEIIDLIYALKITLQNSIFEGSLSWFDGRQPEAGLSGFNTRSAAEQIVLGADFVFTFNKLSLRGETAYSYTQDYTVYTYIPNPEIEWIIGFDTDFIPEVTLGFQYYGKWIEDWNKLEINNAYAIIKDFNRLLWNQTKEYQNNISSIIKLKLFHDTINLDLFGNYNITTEEIQSRIKLHWNLADALNFYTGVNYVSGPNGTRSDLAEDYMQTFFAEIKFSF